MDIINQANAIVQAKAGAENANDTAILATAEERALAYKIAQFNMQAAFSIFQNLLPQLKEKKNPDNE